MKLSNVLQLPVLLASSLLAPAPLVAAEHTSNWAVLVGTSRFWFNYRHLANVLSMYRTVKRLGIPDSQIILMLPDDMACNPRNAFPGTVYSNADRAVDLYGDNIEVDYRGYEVTVENFIRLLTDRVGDEMPRSKRLLTDDRSNIFVYMTGHGGNEFLKFQDAEEIGAFDLADAFEQMWEKRRYHEILFMIDTCQANTMYSKLYSPNIIATGSSELDQSSYSHHADNDVGVAVIDRYTYYNLEFLESEVRDLSSKKTVGDLFDSYNYEKIHSHAGVRYDLFRDGADAARGRLLTDFFGNIQNVEVDGAKNATIDEEMLALSKTIARLREIAEEEAAANDTGKPTAPAREAKRVQTAKPLTDANWWVKKLVGVLPLEPLSITAVPTTTHNVSWSPDAELAIACDDSVFLYLPDFSLHHHHHHPPSSSNPAQHSAARQYKEVALRFPCMEQRHPELNRPLFDVAGAAFPEFEPAPGGGSQPVTSQGSSMNHAVSVAWSPPGLARTRRAALGVLTAGGCLTVYAEGAADDMLSSAAAAFKPGGRSTAPRSLRHWAAAWCVGAGMLLPVAAGCEEEYSREYITAFAWAADTEQEAKMLAYTNDDEEVVLVSVQARHSSRAAPGSMGTWRVEEVVRFFVDGPHPITDPTDPDHSPSGSSYSLSWSPWCNKGRSKVSILSYISKNYVGFRRITISGRNESTKTASVQVSEVDVNGVCLYLAPDAFVVWEDMIWTIDDSKICRGMIATPYKVQAFQIPLDDPSPPPLVRHTTDKCETTYPPINDPNLAQNPITSLVIHPPTTSQPTPAPLYTLVRLAATHENTGWYQTNVPPSPPNTLSHPTDPAPGPETPEPRWAHEILQSIEQQLPRALAYRPALPSHAGGSSPSDADSDSDDATEISEDEDESPWDSDYDYGGEDGEGSTGIVNGIDTSDLVHTARARIWGMAASPGGGVTAVFAALHSAVKPGRDTFGGWRCRVLFGRHDHVHHDHVHHDHVPRAEDSKSKKLTTEGRMWEWMYGGGPPVAGVSGEGAEGEEGGRAAVLRDHFRPVASRLVCAFCDAALEPVGAGKSARCGRGHLFDTCATTGIPIIAPGVSKTCNVCGSKCLKREELLALAPQLRDIVLDEISAEFCGNCGGKFVN
ncbi:peptidase C13 family-domain-containing protein [Whalleya microplaca]|nr:peptidase C13 family-domain-containing protein [Whalleya microplaca]